MFELSAEYGSLVAESLIIGIRMSDAGFIYCLKYFDFEMQGFTAGKAAENCLHY
jgi:hypothetical protein